VAYQVGYVLLNLVFITPIADAFGRSLVGFWINYGINQNMDRASAITFRIPIAMQFVPGGLLAVGTLILRESPAVLYRAGKREKAIENLCYLRQLPADHQYMLEEVGMIEARLAEENKLAGGRKGWLGLLLGSFGEAKAPSIRYRLYVTMNTLHTKADGRTGTSQSGFSCSRIGLVPFVSSE
jgi:hypothetical protein